MGMFFKPLLMQWIKPFYSAMRQFVSQSDDMIYPVEFTMTS